MFGGTSSLHASSLNHSSRRDSLLFSILQLVTMVPENDFSAAFKPLETVQRLFEQETTDSDSDFNSIVENHFKSLFTQEENKLKIPALTPQNYQQLIEIEGGNVSNQGLRRLRLVRWRVMIQDTGVSKSKARVQGEVPSQKLGH